MSSCSRWGMPRGDEDRLIMPMTDMLTKWMLGTDAATKAGLGPQTDATYSFGQAATDTLVKSGLVPDINRASVMMEIGKHLIGAWWTNPYNSYTQRTVYSQKDWDARFSDPMNFIGKQLKQVWNDAGGRSIMPMTTWSEDEKEAGDSQAEWVMSFSKEGDEGVMPVMAKTVFQAVRKIPVLGAAAAGFLTLQTDGNAKIARRLATMRKEEESAINALAKEVYRMTRERGDQYDYSDWLKEKIKGYGWGEEEYAIVEQRALDMDVKKKIEDPDEVIRKETERKGLTTRQRERAERYLRSIGRDEEE